MPMSAPFTVFVCSTFYDLEQEREAVLDAIRRVQSRHVAMEFFGGQTGRPIDDLPRQVRESDVLIVIVGHKYGSLVSGRTVFRTRRLSTKRASLREACAWCISGRQRSRAARRMSRRTRRRRKLLKAWKVRLQSLHTTAKFADSHDLALQVIADLGRVTC